MIENASNGVEVFNRVLYTYLAVGALAALGLIAFGVLRFRGLGQALACLLATLALWAGLFLGVHMGYGAWQRVPDAGTDAFADGADLTGAFMLGWLPAAVTCLAMLAVLHLAKRTLRGAPGPRPLKS